MSNKKTKIFMAKALVAVSEKALSAAANSRFVLIYHQP